MLYCILCVYQIIHNIYVVARLVIGLESLILVLIMHVDNNLNIFVLLL